MRHGPPRLVPDKAWLQSKVQINPDTGCWIFTNKGAPSSVPNKAYGRYQTGRKSYMAHRRAYELYHGPIPEGMLVCHRCDNPKCCNPEHLFLGTNEDNTRDALVKSRLRMGTECGTSKLTRNEVLAIRDDIRPSGEVSKQYGIHRGSVWTLRRGITYGSVH